jgi:acyl-CoA thioesterase-1
MVMIRRVLATTVALGLGAFALMACQPAPSQSGGGGLDPFPEPGQLAESSKVVIPVLGDSITAGLGLTTSQAFPNRLQEMFAGEGYNEVEIQNAGVSGDTTAGGLRRVESILAPNVRIVVVALGGNDALRGLSITQTRENLDAIITQIRGADVGVMLAGMEAPTNLGEDYRSGFRAIYTGLAREYGREVVLVPFLLEGVAGNPVYNQADGIHPNEQGARMIAELLYPKLRDMVDQLPVQPVLPTPR